ncbi:MAG TPA: hypothetical protein VFJ77_02455 [Gaiellaceae bacterium]|nr:hypothetical protein [Gaiellaceae bacterium]
MRVLLAVAGLLSLAGSGSSGPGAQTLYRSTTGPISAFAQDGQLLAWYAPGTRRCNAVHVLSLRGGVSLTLPKPGSSNVTCRWSMGREPVALAIAARQGSTLWTLHQDSSVDLDYVVGADVRVQKERRFYQLGHTRAGAGLWFGALAGDGATLVYSRVVVAYRNQAACLSGGSCARRIAGGSVRRIVGRRDVAVPRTGPALQIAASDGRIAYVRATSVTTGGRPVANATRPLEIRVAANGKLVSRPRPDGVPVAIALAPHVLAVLARSHGRLHLSWYDVASGRRLGRARVPRKTSATLGASDRVVVFHAGRTIEAFDLGSRRAHALTVAASAPIGLSLEGTRVAWAENLRGKGRIRALSLKPR